MDMTVRDAFRRSIFTLTDWISREINISRTYLIFRTYAPVHFRYLFYTRIPPQILFNEKIIWFALFIHYLRVHLELVVVSKPFTHHVGSSIALP